MTSETLNGIENFTSNLTFNNQSANVDLVEDGGNIEDEIDNILKNPVFIDALNVANCVTDAGQSNDIANNASNATTLQNHIDDNTTSDNNSHTTHRTIEKLRIVIPAMASPTTSLHSSSSDSHSPVRSKKNKKRFCIKCCVRFKHTADWLNHCVKHVTLPDVKLVKLDTNNNPYYKDYMERARSKRSRSPSDTESLKIKLKIPRDNMSTFSANSVGDSNPGTPAATPPVQNECRIRVLRAEEIKQSPPRSPIKHTLPDHAMVAVPSENRVHYECPTLDGLNQFAEDAMNEESTAQILKQLLETPNEPPPETNDWDSTSNEFISIDRLAHTCKTCNEKYPDLNFLREHQRLTGHGDRGGFLSPTMLEPIQEMTVDPMQRYHPPQTNHLEHISKNAQHPPPPHPVSMYGQPPVLPIHQMENQVRNFGNMGPMINRPRYMASRHPSQMPPPPPNYPMHRNYPMQPSQPMNMAPFLEMNPDMYNPQQQAGNSMPMNGYDRPPNQMMHRFHMPQQQQQPGLPPPSQRMSQQMPPSQSHDQAMMQRYSLQQQQQQQQQASSQQRPPATMNGPLSVNRPLRNLPPYPMRPHPHLNGMGKPSQMMPPISALEQQQQQQQQQQYQQQKARFEQMVRNREIENRPFISNAPPTEGLPRIESVQSGAITLNSAKKPTEPNPTIQINDQITLSVKNKDSSSATTTRVLEKQPSVLAGATSAAAAAAAAAAAVAAAAATASIPPPPSLPINDANKMKTFLANRGITVKSTSKLLEKSKQIDDSNKTPYSSAEAAVQKLQMNNSVSIISKKVSASPSTSVQPSPQSQSPASTPVVKDTIDLSNDDDTPVMMVPSTSRSTDAAKSSAKSRPTILKCPIKKCDMRFSNVRALRDHSLRVHQLNRLNKFKCTICSTRFPSTDAVKAHIQKMHADKVNVKSEFGIPIVNFNDPIIRKKMLSLGFTNFLPITNARSEKAELFGMPIINISGPSINNLKNLFDIDSAKIMPISSMRTIPRSQPPTPTPAASSPSSSSSSVQITTTAQPSASSQSNHTTRIVPKLLSASSSTITHPAETLSALLQKPRM